MEKKAATRIRGGPPTLFTGGPSDFPGTFTINSYSTKENEHVIGGLKSLVLVKVGFHRFYINPSLVINTGSQAKGKGYFEGRFGHQSRKLKLSTPFLGHREVAP